ncbi:MAG TPA: lasso peptide biosynthesis B2 protein [Steroidobacteraceae bacterium]|jgi:transglutaminase superfamily protein|nr:lasso peptide biosynthesis B2 protein [Steroidobacteraceae bacterium]
MHQYWIPAHVRVCPLLASTILLDLERNRYFGIGMNETRALSTLALNWNEANGSAAAVEQLAPDAAIAMADALIAAGLLSRDPPGDRATFGAPPLTLSGVTSAGHELSRRAALRLAHVASFLAALAWTRRALRSRTLYSIASEVRDRKASAGSAFDEQRAVELVGIFRRLRPHTFAARDRCLFHSLALVRFMARHDVFPTWVIGVRAKPWGAHAWVQQGKLLLDANPEQVCEYTPILTV